MEFNSLTYALFFAVVVALYYAPFMRASARQNGMVLCASYIFYGVWDWRFLGLIMLTTLTSYFTGIAIEGRRRRWALVGNIVLNLGILGLFKYFNFFGDNIAWLLRWFGWEVDWVFLEILLPVGISFYTFQAIGYTVDVWRGDAKPSRDPLLFATFIAYFPQLVAGPIERASRLMPQLERVHYWDYSRAVRGMRQILWGMLKKIAVADPCGQVVSAYYDGGDAGWMGIKIYVAALFFAIQIYCDFSGYCDIAQGSARILGVDLVDNFKRPFFSRSYLELWRRWHVSLMEWFMSYVYFPLGGSRVGTFRKHFNLMVVFLLSGIWHGAAWGYVAWGAYCGVMCVIEKIAGVKSYSHSGTVSLRDLPRMAYTFALFVTGCVFVRVPDVGQALGWIALYVLPWSVAVVVAAFCAVWIGRKLFSLSLFGSYVRQTVWLLIAGCLALAVLRPEFFWFHFYWVVIVMVMAMEWVTRRQAVTIFPVPSCRTGRFALYLLFYLIVLAYGFFHLPPILDQTQFIYFQF